MVHRTSKEKWGRVEYLNSLLTIPLYHSIVFRAYMALNVDSNR
jgi:hypothetical protein